MTVWHQQYTFFLFFFCFVFLEGISLLDFYFGRDLLFLGGNRAIAHLNANTGWNRDMGLRDLVKTAFLLFRESQKINSVIFLDFESS